MKIKCKVCGAKISSKSKFCPACGNEISSEKENIIENNDIYISPNIAFVSYGDIFSGDNFWRESFHFTVAGKNNIVMGKSIKSLSAGDILIFDSKKYRIIGFLNLLRRFVDDIGPQELCGVVLDTSIDKKKLKMILKKCPASDKYAPFYFNEN